MQIILGRTEPRRPVAQPAILKGETAEIKKLDKEQQLVFGEVYAPGYPDSQGDFMSAAGIQQMAYRFMKKAQLTNIDTMHTRQRSGAYVVESFIARKGDATFMEGAWVLGVHIPDAATWDLVKKGELNGFSLDGIGFRESQVFEIDVPDEITGRTMLAKIDGVDHDHDFLVKYDADGNFLGGWTGPGGPDNHRHRILRGTATEKCGDHAHRFDFVSGLLNIGFAD